VNSKTCPIVQMQSKYRDDILDRQTRSTLFQWGNEESILVSAMVGDDVTGPGRIERCGDRWDIRREALINRQVQVGCPTEYAKAC
jgi:hypothetical protein